MSWKDTFKKHKDSLKDYAVEFAVSAGLSLLKKLFKRKDTTPETPKAAPEVPRPPAPVETPEIDRKVTWIASPNCSARPAGTLIRAIILHHTGAMTVKSTLSWFQSKDSGVSAHYVVDRNGDLYQMVKDSDKSWHAGESELQGLKDVNRFSIGIEIVGDGVTAFTKEQYEAVAWLVKTLRKKYDIGDGWIVGHKDIAPGRKVDPEPFDWELFWRLVRKK